MIGHSKTSMAASYLERLESPFQLFNNDTDGEVLAESLHLEMDLVQVGKAAFKHNYHIPLCS